MKRLEIRFSVDSKGLLQCPQLASEVDPQQDAGTLYGLSSQIILRNVVNPERRTVLVPIGDIYWQRRGIHVDVKVANHGLYANFIIVKVLGRLDCPPEPLLLYLKAALHAPTSFPLPDGLTLRTGTEGSQQLEVFSKGATTDCNTNSQVNTPNILSRRGRIRRQLYERVSFPSDVDDLADALETSPYDPRQHSQTKESCRVYQTTRALRVSTNNIPKLTSLSTLMENWANVGGFQDALLAFYIESLLSVEISQSWGSFVQFCRRVGQLQSYDVYFLLALLVFDTDLDVKVIQWLVALCKVPELRDVEPPEHTSFSSFRFLEKPSMDSIRSKILATQPSYDDTFQSRQKKQARNRIRVTVDEYEKGQRDEATHLASLVVDAWPHPPRSADEFMRSIDDLTLDYVHFNKAWKVLQPEIHKLLHNLDLSAYLNQLEDAASRLYLQQS
ncbi:hypothetical protein FOBRF1_014672 [Fusarium oxysporum]